MRFRASFWLALAGVIFTLTARAVPPADPTRFEKDIQVFEAADQKNPPKKGGVLFVGSSSIRLWTNVAEAFPDWNVVRRGFGGAHLSDVNAFFDRIVSPYKPATIILYAGENDIAAGRGPEDVFEEFKKFARSVREKLPKTSIYFLSMKPSPSRWYLWPQMKEGNASVRSYARWHPGVTYVDVGAPLLRKEGQPDPGLFRKDQLHLSGEGYDLWAKVIREAVKGE